ncbi:dihydrofolate reductase family protein [Conexibacter sp. SYSU D00693]|uniref:dihydrofolate reductase family protein n=1 Tax=Conexibacter sp. SYSU D00693 TaxID=2812560 RepID=UPI00196A55FA|nr:dihydrofolate reductase family protein [Conexibacter sp. SYSU D00693]
MQIIVNDFISLDGVVQAPGGPDEDRDGGFAHGGWSHPYFDVEAMGSVFDELMGSADVLLYGRGTWQNMAAAWPERAGDPFADAINSAEKLVLSRTLTDADMTWEGSRLLPADDAIGALRELKEQRDGRMLLLGSPTVATQLFEADLVDELVLMLEPILLGGGKSIFPQDGAARPLELAQVKQASTGVLICTYRVVRG